MAFKSDEIKKAWHRQHYIDNKERYQAWGRTRRNKPENKELDKMYSKEWRETNAEYLKLSKKEYYDTHRDEILAKNKEYRERNKELLQSRAKESRERHKAKRIEGNRRWRQSNQEKIREWKRNNKERAVVLQQKRKATQKGNGGSFSVEEWTCLKNMFGNYCLCCGRRDMVLAVDHVIPISKGGKNTVDNLQPLCTSCNSKKRTKIIDFRPFYRLLVLSGGRSV